MATVDNPRFPHTCKIYRVVEEDSFSDGEQVVIYEGECRKSGSTNLRTFKTDNVIKADYYLAVPGTVVGIKSGDYVDVTDRQGSYTKCLITDSYAGNLGTSVYFNLPKN